MTSYSKLSYIGTVIVMIGLGVSILTVMRGLSTPIFTYRFGLPSNYTSFLHFPPMWPPRNVRIAVYLISGEIDLLIFDRSNYDLFMSSGDATPLREFKGLGGGTFNFEIPVRGEYYIVVRNRGESTVDGEVVLTFWGFESDLTHLSIILLILGTVLWIWGRFFGRRLKPRWLILFQ